MSSVSNKSSEKMKLAPFRSMNDFVLDGSKYLAPPFSDTKRLNNRITSNLLYYQTNYFALSAVVFLIFSLFRLNLILGGAFGLVVTTATVLFGLDKIPQASDLRSRYPFAIYIAGAINLMILFSTFRPILFLGLIVLVPILGWIAHASTRSRGIKNKIGNKVEQLGGAVYTNTPMGYLLSSLGYETKDFDE